MDFLKRSASKVFSHLVHIFDAGFVDQHAAAVANLDCIGVVPLDNSLDALAILQDKDHRRSLLRLLLQIESLRVNYRRNGDCSALVPNAGTEKTGPRGGEACRSSRQKAGADELARPR